MRLAALLLCFLAPAAFAASPRIAFERVLPAPHDLGRNRDVAIVHAIGDSAKIETFIELFIEKANHSGFHRIRDARAATGPADVYLVIKEFSCESFTREGEGSVRDYEGKRVKRVLRWQEAVCRTRVDVMSSEMKRVSSFHGKGEGISPRTDHITDEERGIALQLAARYAAVDAAAQITPRRVREIIPLDETAPAFDEGMGLIDSFAHGGEVEVEGGVAGLLLQRGLPPPARLDQTPRWATARPPSATTPPPNSSRPGKRGTRARCGCSRGGSRERCGSPQRRRVHRVGRRLFLKKALRPTLVASASLR